MKAYCHLKAIPMRAEASDRSEMVNQMLLGDTAEVVEQQEKWSLVQCHYDGYRGWVDNKQVVFFSSAAMLAERLFLDTPYLWGGRSTGGIDCSGLTQVCFKAMDVWLPRDASQQATCGVEVCACDLQCDDLAFFANDAGRIVHVGICRGDGTIIHSSGCVRIDTLDARGIFNRQTDCYTHRLAFVRRMA